jgi:DNA ligase 1
MEYSKTVYKKDTKGKIRQLTVSSDNGKLIQESGIVGGKLTPKVSQCKAKNVGRANETTPEEQARLEAKSKIETKMSEGYFDTIEEAENEVVILPMLAKSYDKEAKKVEFPCYVQPKLDGMRALIVVKDGEVSMISRKGKEITTLPHIIESIKSVGFTNIILDGELYVHGESFQKNISLIKKYRPGESERIKFRWYDIVQDTPFEERMFSLQIMLNTHIEHVMSVGTVPVQNEEDIKKLHQLFLAEGYEGTMVRWGTAGYKIGGRSSNLLKYKDFLDEAYEVVDVEPSEKNPEQGVVVCKMKDGRTFGCGMKFSHAEREEILSNKEEYIGQIAEVRFFEYTDSGLPRFPVCVGFRLDK